MKTEYTGERFIGPKTAVAARYLKSPRTITRWIESGDFPPPDLVRGTGAGKREYWKEQATLIPWERQHQPHAS